MTYKFRISNLIWVCLALLFLNAASRQGCSSSRRSAVLTPASKPRSAEYLAEKLRKNANSDLRFLSAKAKLYSEMEGSGLESVANIIWFRDSAIWINIKKYGIEAARALIRPDSAFILYRINQTYSAYSMHELQRNFNLPEGFPLLQNLLLAEAWLPEGRVFQSGIKDSLYRLSTALPNYTIDYRIEEGRYLLRKAIFLQPQESRTLSLDFERYEKLSGIGYFPYLRHLESYSPEGGSLRLEVELFDIDVNEPKSYRFEIPAHYTRVE